MKRTHVVVTFRSESSVPAAKLSDLLSMGTVAASTVQAELMITTTGSTERACIIKYVLANVSLNGCWKVGSISER